MNLLAVVSGGDAPGIGSALYHLTRAAEARGDTVYGARGGFPSVLAGAIDRLHPAALLPWCGMGGSPLASSRDPVLAEAAARDGIRAAIERLAIDGIVLFGGDGSLRYLPPILQSWGVACIGIPTTIDNDVAGTEMTLGFDSACNFAYQAVDGIRATGSALSGRIFTLETLGGHSGFLALAIAHAAGADAVLVPEFSYNTDTIAARLAQAVAAHGQALLVYTEFTADKDALLTAIPAKTGIRIRSSALGHAQRGGAPSHRDRALAAEMTAQAIGALHDGLTAGVVIVRDGQVRLHEGVIDPSTAKTPDRALYDRLNGMVP